MTKLSDAEYEQWGSTSALALIHTVSLSSGHCASVEPIRSIRPVCGRG